MKYGDTLRQRSIPEWGHFNIDYDHLKDLIKHQTTPGTNKAVSIPGQGESTERAFGDTFFTALKAQHDRINLFIRSKSGEIERRLEHISKTLQHLQTRQTTTGTGDRLPARAVERYAKIDADVTKAGEEIRSLSRFQVAQRTGFRKILKKYKRWTRDSELERHFRDDVTRRPDSFYQLDLGYLLDQYIDVLGALRAPFDASREGSLSSSAKTSLPAARISKAAQHGTEIDLDIALSITPLGTRGSKATYWIHPDHIVEVQVLLLEHMCLHTVADATAVGTPQGSTDATPKRRKSSATVDRYLGSEESVGLLVLDHAESFAIKQNASTIGSSEELAGTLQAKAAGNARWTSSGDAAVVVGLEQASGEKSTAKLRRKHLAAFLNTSVPSNTRQDSGLQDQTSGEIGEQTTDDTEAVRQWLTEHREVKPVAGICSNRTRFVGLHNNRDGGLWATLDRDVFMKNDLHKHLHDEESLSEARRDSKEFPFAVLEIRREGSYSSTLFQILDRSHLVERVRGFSLEAHVVWTCCKPSAMSAPIWTSLLDRDIRKLPPPVRRHRRKGSSAAGSTSQTSPPQTSASGTSLTDGQMSPFTTRQGESSATSAPEFVDPPPLQAFRKKRKPYADYPPPMQAEPESQRYWNEYDNPESEDEGYYIYVDPDASVKFPGQELFEAWVTQTKRLFGIEEEPEEEPLLSTGESSDDETADESPIATTKSYGTFARGSSNQQHEGYFSGLFRSLRDPHRDIEALDSIRRQTERERRSLLSKLELRQHKIEMAKMRLYTTCIVMAIVIDIILGTMTMTSRKKERGVVDSVVLFGTICNLLLCVIAVISMMSRRERLGWVHQGVVLVVVIGNVLVAGILLRWVFSVLQ